MLTGQKAGEHPGWVASPSGLQSAGSWFVISLASFLHSKVFSSHKLECLGVSMKAKSKNIHCVTVYQIVHFYM